jgi:hypothetical protein
VFLFLGEVPKVDVEFRSVGFGYEDGSTVSHCFLFHDIIKGMIKLVV